MGTPSSLSREERNKRLVEAGNELLNQPLPSTKEELLEKLDNLEHLLSMVGQVAPTQDAFQPAMEALAADGLLQHPDVDVKVSVASCISEIMRITAPEQPYNDGITKVFFELAVLAIGKLSCMDDHCYSKAVSIIEVLAKYRTCVLMLDLELDALVVQMFQHFLNSIRPDHPDHVYMDIEEMMSAIIIESDIIPIELLITLLSSVKKDNQNVSPRSYMLGERVLERSALKLRPDLPKALRSLGIPTNGYSEVVESILSDAVKSETKKAIKSLPSSRPGEIDQPVDGTSKSQLENGHEEPCHKVACFDDVSPLTEETSKCLPDTDSKVAAADDRVVMLGPSVDNAFKSLVNNDCQELSHKSPTNRDTIELAQHTACDKVTPFTDQSSALLEKDDPENEENDIVPEMDATLKGSQHGDAMKRHKITDSRTSSRPENMGFIYAVDKELDPEAAQASKKRGWKPNFLNKPEEGYDHAWLSGERRPKARIPWQHGKGTKKRSRRSPKCAISNGLYLSSNVEKTQIMTSIKRHQRAINDKIGPKDGPKISSISARDVAGALTKKNVSQPTLVDSEEFIVLETSEEKHEKPGKKNVPAKYRDKGRSSIEESGIQAFGSVSITKKRNSAETSKEQKKRKNLLSQEDALGSVSITKRINLAKTSKEQRKRKNSPSQEDSADKVVREHNEDLVGCRVRVWWPLDQTFYEGQITSFDSSEKRHMVLYDDGEQENLDLTNERWELVGHDNASDARQEIVHGPSDLSNMRLGCIIDSYRHLKKEKKVLNVDDVAAVRTPGTGSKKIGSSKLKLCRVKATDDLAPPSTMTMQHTPKGVHLNKRIKVDGSDSGTERNLMRWTTPGKASPGSPIEDGDECSELVDVHGYKVKKSSAPTLAAIFAKYGDIAVNCHYKSPTVKASLLEVVSDVVKQLISSGIGTKYTAIQAMKSVVNDAADAKLDVAWLQQYLEEIPEEEEDMRKRSSNLMELRVTTMLVSKAAKKDLVERNKEVLAAEKRLKKAERRLQEAQSRAGEAARSVKVLEIFGEKNKEDIKESKDQVQCWQSRWNELL